MNVCGLIGILFTVTGLVLVLVASVVPRFVDVYVVKFADDINDSNTIAGVGVYNSFYDADRIEPEVVAESRVPNILIESKTQEFPLLFPVQEQFILDVLPLSSGIAGQLADAVGDAAVGDQVLALLQPVEDLVFNDDCTAYVTDLVTVTSTLFLNTQLGLIPEISTVVAGGIALQVNAGLQTGVQGLQADNQLNGFLRFLGGVAASDGFNACSITDPAVDVLIQDQVDCLALAFATAGSNTIGVGAQELGELFVGAGNAFVASCVGGTVNDCLDAGIFFGFDDVPLIEAQTFGDVNNLCELFSGCEVDTTGFEYVQILTTLASQNAGLEAVQGLLGLHLGGGAALSSTFFAFTASNFGFNPDDLDAVVPPTFTEEYQPCEYYNILAILGELSLQTLDGVECTFQNFFVAAEELLIIQENDLAPVIGGLGFLFGQCASASSEFSTAICPGIFAGGFVSNALNFEVPPESGVDVLIETGSQKCEDTVVDNEKVLSAQAALISSYPFFALALILPLAALCAPTFDVALYVVSALTSALAGFLVIGALLIVASAPVYNGVGEEPNEGFDEADRDDLAFEIFFVGGPIGLLAFANGAIMIVAGVCYVIAAVNSCRSGGDDGDEVDYKQKEDMTPVASPEPSDKVAVTDVGTGENVTI